ncbi:MAG: DUF4845 domain-containing protein [Gammaproteobacteria bacterium]|nr:MAG: DUF4845 domain-containing protein [Gammaproteobacteria bacterium]
MQLRSQRGSFIGWFMVIVVILGISSVVIRLVPHYVDYRTMRSVLQEMVDDDRIARSNAAAFQRTFNERLRLNNIRGFDVANALTVEARTGTLTVDLRYEVREPLFGNADIVLKFEESFERVLR